MASANTLCKQLLGVKSAVVTDGVKELTVDDGETFPLDRSIDVSDFKL